MDSVIDLRFPTRDIQLAQTLATFGFEFKKGAHVSDTILAKTEERFQQWWFEPKHPQWGAAVAIEHALAQGEAFTAAHPQDPLTHMRAAILARALALAIIHGEKQIAGVPDWNLKHFSTDDLKLVAVLLARGHALVKYQRPQFTFLADRDLPKTVDRFHARRSGDPVKWMVYCLRNGDECRRMLRSPGLVPMILTVQGAQHTLLAADASDELRMQFYT